MVKARLAYWRSDMRRTSEYLVSGRRHLACAIAAAFLLVVGSPAVSDQRGNVAVSLDAAIALVRDKTGGKVLRAETKRKNDHAVHEIRILTDDGHVRTYVVDGKTGKVK